MMLDQFRSLGLFSLAELNYLRLEAMDLFERCLTEGSPDYFLDFIETQVAHDPPRVELLREVAEDLHQRLLSLREYHFDVRDRVLRSLRVDFNVDLSSLAPANALESYHLLDLDESLHYIGQTNPDLTPRDQFLLRKVLEASLEMASQLHEDVQMTEELFDCVMDWADGLSASAARRYWLNDWEQDDSPVLH